MYYVMIYLSDIILSIKEFTDYEPACQYVMYHTLRQSAHRNVFCPLQQEAILTRMPPPYVQRSKDNEYSVCVTDILENCDVSHLSIAERAQYKDDRALLLQFLKQIHKL